MHPVARAHMAHTLAARLSGLTGTWTADGDVVRGPGTPVVQLTDLHDGAASPGHVDVRVALDQDRPDAPVIVDCVSGFGDTPERTAESAAHLWVETTGSALMELMTARGEFADHYSAAEPDGLPGFHVIHSPALVYGIDPAPLRDWVPANPLLPALRTTLPGHLTAPLNGVKLLFGGKPGEEVAEVRVNGAVAGDVSAALATMDWPRTDGSAFARVFLLAFEETA